MARVLFRVIILAGGLGFGELGLDSLARGDPLAVVQVFLAFLLLIAGTAGFIVPLLESRGRPEVMRDV